MNHNLTENQKKLARWIVQQIRERKLAETFRLVNPGGRISVEGIGELRGSVGDLNFEEVNSGTFEALIADGLLLRQIEEAHRVQMDAATYTLQPEKTVLTATGRLYRAVESNFADVEKEVPISTLARPHPPEIAISIDRLRAKYPDPKKLGFLVMRFTAAKPFERIVQMIKETAGKHDLIVIRADENEFHADLWGNVRTHLHGCGFGIAVYERIESEEPNANVGLEVGYLMAMNKPILLLKDKTVAALPADLAGKLYKLFDPHDPEGTIPDQLTKWLEDNGIIVPPHE